MGKSYQVRLNSDRLNIKFEAAENNNALFNLSGLKLQLALNQGLLSFLDPETFLYVFIDTSGSMNSSIPTITTAINQLKILLKDSVYKTDELLAQRVFQINFGDERWVKLFTQYNQPKAFYLIWINEASPTYHSGSNYSPTASYNSDLTNFVSGFNSRQKFKAIVYSIEFNSGEFTTFQNHLTAAVAGKNGYSPALKDYGVELRLSVPQSTTATEYYNDFLEISN